MVRRALAVVPLLCSIATLAALSLGYDRVGAVFAVGIVVSILLPRVIWGD
jgi:hypothetical protein